MASGSSVVFRRTLINLYNQPPAWLGLAHKKLDRTVLDAYSWPHDIAAAEILAQRLALKLEQAVGQCDVARGEQPTDDGAEV